MPCFWALRALNTPASAEPASLPSIQRNQNQTGAETPETGNQAHGLGGNFNRLPPQGPNDGQALSDRDEKCSTLQKYCEYISLVTNSR